jgi:SAM-dependent methyltransferase
MWNSGASYESYIGRWSRLVANQFVPWLHITAGAQWLDIGCGTGNLSQTILERADPQSVLGIDSSEGYIEFARMQINDSRITFRLGDAQALQVESASYDAAVSGLVLNFVPHPRQALREMIRAVRVGGTVAAYVWDYVGQMQLMRKFWDAAVELDRKAASALDEGQQFPICQPDRLQQLFQTRQLFPTSCLRSSEVTFPHTFQSGIVKFASTPLLLYCKTAKPLSERYCAISKYGHTSLGPI